jgi:hypothetical protein
METLATALILVSAFFIPVQDVTTQSAEMPVPALVVKDADGKVIGRVVGDGIPTREAGGDRCSYAS